jgi:hypothetical protein
MVAYSFKKQFAAPIVAGTKRQTIRADRKRHARPDEVLQLYTGMRTRQCALIGNAVCESVRAVRIDLENQIVELPDLGYRWGVEGGRLRMFAKLDGFHSWEDMRAFWRQEHPGRPVFVGVLIRWRDFEARGLGGPALVPQVGAR